jgi:hypothetical protein
MCAFGLVVNLCATSQAANGGAASVALQCQLASFTADSVLINPSVVGTLDPAPVQCREYG